MDIELHLQVWNELKEHIISADRTDASDDFIRVLIEHGADANKILEFALDDELKESLSEYIEVEEEEFDDDFEDEYD